MHSDTVVAIDSTSDTVDFDESALDLIFTEPPEGT